MNARSVNDLAISAPSPGITVRANAKASGWTHIHVRGLVQGVGFRPLVYGLAHEAGLVGRVANGADGVHIDLNANRREAESFLDRLLEALPSYGYVSSIALTDAPAQEWTDFRIADSAASNAPQMIIPPDRNLCPDCRRDLRDPANRRFGYPFTTCLRCGPRYSIITALPYDRERSAMQPYAMCKPCATEYTDPGDRHHHAQTNSCPDCRIPMQWYDATGMDMRLDQASIIPAAAAALADGKIIGVKGLGGFLLMADARRGEVVRKLRERKHRPSKPFALLYPDLDSIQGDAHVSPAERSALLSPEGPIVLLNVQAQPASGLATEAIAPGLNRIGAMLPATALLDMLLQDFPHPVIATSGNISGSPILHQDEEAIAGLYGIADHVLGYSRDITNPQDDSVVQFATPADAQPIILRRSRGLAPAFYPNPFSGIKDNVLALGAHMKGAFAIAARGNLHVSPWLGNLESFEARESYRAAMDRMLDLLDVRPDVILTDRHPGYFTTQLGEQLASTWKAPLLTYGHHEAHFAAVLAENGLLDTVEPVLGVIWDGTGLGDDGNSWGGEFFIYRDHQFTRQSHFETVPVLLGDKMALEPRLSALAVCHDMPDAAAILESKFTPTEWMLYNRKVDSGGIRTTSVGRLFDAVASILGLADRQSYEGEAAMRLEALAWGAPDAAAYPMGEFSGEGAIPTAEILLAIIEDLGRGRSRDSIAAAFHRTLIAVIARVAASAGITRIALSGGVWQNGFLNCCAREHLTPAFEVICHQRLSPNDENIPFGQLARWAIDRGIL